MTNQPWVPATSDVAAHLRLFLVDDNGNRVTDFTSATSITDTDADRAIQSTVADIQGACGDIPEVLHQSASKTAAIGAAAEAVVDVDERGRELYRELRILYEDRLKRLITSCQDARDGNQDGVSTVPASWSGPPATGFGGLFRGPFGGPAGFS